MYPGRAMYLIFLILFLQSNNNLNPGGQDASNPCQTGWHYIAKYGLCYHGIDGQVFQMEQAREACSKLKSQETDPAIVLAQFFSREMFQEVGKLIDKDDLKLPVWVGVYRTASHLHFNWLDSNKQASFDFLEWEGDAGSADCVQVINGDSYYALQTKFTVIIADCSSEATALCQQEAPRCVDPPGEFDSKTMTFAPHPPFVGTEVKTVCRPGYSKDTAKLSSTRSSGSDVDNSLNRGVYKCTRATNSAGVPMAPQFIYSGYTTVPCLAVECPPVTAPKNGQVISESPDTGVVYKDSSNPNFYDYGQTLTYSCTEGFIFPSRQIDIKVTCAVNPANALKGIYTSLSGQNPDTPKDCIPATCLSEEVSIKPGHNLMPNMKLVEPGTAITEISQHTEKHYKAKTEVHFTCQDGFVTYDEATEFSVTCSDHGNWAPKLAGCGRIQEALPVGHDGKFEGEVTEGEAAKRFSTVMLCCVFILLVVITALDCLTCPRDVQRLRRNFELQKRRWNRMKGLKTPDENQQGSLSGDSGDVKID